jgi:hypothetical protein
MWGERRILESHIEHGATSVSTIRSPERALQDSSYESRRRDMPTPSCILALEKMRGLLSAQTLVPPRSIAGMIGLGNLTAITAPTGTPLRRLFGDFVQSPLWSARCLPSYSEEHYPWSGRIWRSPTPSTEDRFLGLPVRSMDRCQRQQRVESRLTETAG